MITQVDGKDVASPKELARLIGAYAPGKSVDVTVWRDGKTETIKVDLGKLPATDKQASAEQPAAPAKPDTLADLGLTVTKSEDGKGLVVTDVDPDSDAADRGIQPGDIITSVNSTEVNGTDDVAKAMADAVEVRPQGGADADHPRRQQPLRRAAGRQGLTTGPTFPVRRPSTPEPSHRKVWGRAR